MQNKTPVKVGGVLLHRQWIKVGLCAFATSKGVGRPSAVSKGFTTYPDWFRVFHWKRNGKCYSGSGFRTHDSGLLMLYGKQGSDDADCDCLPQPQVSLFGLCA